MINYFEMSLLERISGPADLQGLSMPDLRRLSQEIRQSIIETVQRNGGHLASNLGVVELTIALHRVFQSPYDAIVWDVGHQCYSHKILTGRAARFVTLRRKGGLSGFPKRKESKHDVFDTGHSSTAISSALGLLQARLSTGHAGRVIAVVGDGALTAGLSMEGLSNAGQLGLPLIIVLNDNRMSISHSVGSMSRYLSKLSASVRYQSLRSRVDAAVLRIPRIGEALFSLINRTKRAIKAIFFKENLFVDYGFEYVGPIDGHNLVSLIDTFEHVRKLNRPVVVHVVTRKGKGLEKAEEDPESFHGLGPACPDIPGPGSISHGESFTSCFANALIRCAEKEPRMVAITAAMSSGTGVAKLAERYPHRVYDVGIAEQHAVAFAAGLAQGGLRPVVAVYSTFMQRALDQVFQEVALAKQPVLFALDRAGAVGEDGETHQGIYDIVLFKAMPNLLFFAPADGEELSAFMDLAITLDLPCMMRYPKAFSHSSTLPIAPLEIGRGVFMREHDDARILILAVGPLSYIAAEVSDELETKGIVADVYNIRFISPIDEEHLVDICSRYDGVLTIEDGVLNGGLGESVAGILMRKGMQIKISSLGFGSMPLAQATREELLSSAGLDSKGIQKALYDLLNSLDLSKQQLGTGIPANLSERLSTPSEIQHAH